MNYMEKVAEMLGVELGEEFEIEMIYGTFSINENGLDTENKGHVVFDITMVDLLKGVLKIKKLPWKPKNGDMYFYPYFVVDGGIYHGRWSNHNIDFSIQKTVGCYRTKEEAIAKAKELGWVD